MIFEQKQKVDSGHSVPVVSVFGSINMDLVIRCRTLPRSGETVSGESANEVSGGKGANQAVAAAKAGGQVRMIGRVGDDVFSPRLLANLREQNVNCEGISRSKQCASGLAVVAVEDSGENSIPIVAGANGDVSPADVELHRELIESSAVLLLQLEVPTASVLRTIEIARNAGVRVVLDPAPVARDWTDELLKVDLICPNESEAATLTELPVETFSEIEAAMRQLQSRGAENVVMTLGERGTALLMGETFQLFEPTSVEAVDTTAAGDAFAGALGVRWAETNDLVEAVRFASVAGALAATRHGAQPSLPTRAEIDTKRNQK